MAKTQAELDSAIKEENATIADVAQRVSADFKALRDQVAAGAQPADLQAQWDQIQNNLALLHQIDAPIPPQ